MISGEVHKKTENQPGTFFPAGELWLFPNDLALFQTRRKIFSAPLRAGAPGPDSFQVLLAPRVMTIGRLERQLASELSPPLTGELERSFILHRLAQELPEILGLKKKPDQPALLALADDLGRGFDRLKLAGLDWERLHRAAPRRLTARLAELGRRYDGILAAAGLADRFGRRRELVDQLRRGRRFQALAGVERIVGQSWQRLSPFELEFLTALLRPGRRLELELDVWPWVRAEALNSGLDFEQYRLIRELEKVDAPGFFLSFADRRAKVESGLPEVLVRASEQLLAPPGWLDPDDRPGTPRPGNCLTIVQTPTAYHETEEAGRRLKTLLREGIHPETLALVVPDLSRYRPLIEDVSRRFGLPFYFRRGPTLLDQAPVRAILELLSLWDSHWEAARLIRLLSSPYFAAWRDLGPGELTRLIVSSGVSDQRAGGGFDDNLAKLRGSEREPASGRLLADLRRLREAGRDLASTPTWGAFIAIFTDLLEELGWPGTAVLPFEADPDGRLTARDQETARAFRDVLEKLRNALSSSWAPEVGLDNFRLWLKRALAETREQAEDGPAGKIWALNYHELHGCRFDEIFLLGLSEGSFPRLPSPGSWWPEELRQALSRDLLGRSLWSGPAEQWRREEELLAAALGQARGRVWLYSHREDMSGRPVALSPLLEALKDICPPGTVREELRPWPNPPAPDQVRTRDELWSHLASRPPEEWPRPLQRDERILAEAAALKRRRDRGDKFTGLQPDPALLQPWLNSLDRYKGRPLIPPGLLTAYAECGLKFWRGWVLGLDALGQPLEEWSRTLEGTLLHEVLEDFFLPLTQGKKTWPDGRDHTETFQELSLLLNRRWEWMARRRPMGRTPLWELRRQRLLELLSAWLTRELARPEPLRPQVLEWSFGSSPGSPPWSLSLDDGQLLHFKGRVDRVDRLANGRLEVVDYKLKYRDDLKWRDDSPSPALYPVLIYSLAAASVWGRIATGRLDFLEQDPAGRPMELPDSDSEVLSLDQTQRRELAEAGRFNLANRLAALWADLYAGRLQPPPESSAFCDWCEYGLICPGRESGFDS